MVLSASPPISPTLNSLLDQIAVELSQDQNLLRIKKLLFYVCTGTWETDRQRLNRAELRVLLQHVFEMSLTFEALQQQLNQSVATLNKSAEYTIIANTVISRFHAVYAEIRDQPAPASPSVYQAIARCIEQETERVRIKKLLLLTCRSTWENDTRKLEQLNLLELAQELHQLAPTSASLSATVNQVAKALSKPDEYATIASRIVALFQPLYPAQSRYQNSNECFTGIRAEMLPLPNLCSSQISPSPTQTADLPHPPLKVIKSAKRQQPALSPTAPQTTPAAKPALKVLTIAQPRKITDLFDLRLEIMLSTNPLKAKILLFSLLHEPFKEQTEQDAMLKGHELEDLLRVLFLSYRLYSEADSKLRQTAISLSSSEYLQTAEAILRAIQPVYTEVVAAPTAPAHPTAHVSLSEITDVRLDTHEVTAPDAPKPLH